MTEGTLRVGVVGVGSIAREVHLPILRHQAGIEVVGLVDSQPAALARGLAESGFGLEFASVEGLLAGRRPDCALVLTPEQFRYPVVKTLLAAGVDVFCEKPLTMRLGEAEGLVELARGRGRVLKDDPE